MKTTFKNPQFVFYLAFLIGSLLFFGCGSDNVTGVVLPVDETLSEPFRFPSGTSGPLWQLSDRDIAEILESHSADWYLREHGEWREKGRHGQLLKQFGDIPEVRYLIAFDRYPGQKTREQFIAKSEALYRLFPDENTLKALRQVTQLPDLTKPGRPETEREWVMRDPEGYYEYLLGSLIEAHGDIPEVYTVARIALKIKQGKMVTRAEGEADKEAVNFLRKDEQDDPPPDGPPPR